MAKFADLQTAWGKLGPVLRSKCAGTTGSVGEICTGALGRRTQISNRVADWNKLPGESGGYDSVIAALNSAIQQLNGGATAASLASADQAMDQVQALLDNA